MRIIKKIGILFIGILTFTNCSTEDTPLEEQTNQKPSVSLKNVVSNDNTNVVSGELIATDSDGTISEKKIEAKTSDGTLVNISISSDGTFNHTFTNGGKTFNTLIATVRDNDNTSNEFSLTLNPTISVQFPNTAPVIQSFVVNAVDQYTQIGDVVGTIEARDDEADDLTYTLNDGDDIEENDKFYLDGNLVKAKVLFGQEPLHQQHPLTAGVSDGEFGDEQSVTVDEIGGNGDPETFVQPDIEVQRSIHTGSYTFNPTYLRDGVAVITKTELADNDPNTAEYKYDIVNGVDGTTRADLAEVEAAIEATGLGDATPLNLAPTIAGGYGIAGFRKTTSEELNANDQSVLVNEHGEFVSGPGFKKVIQFFKENFGVTGADQFVNDPKGDRNLQNARACVVMHTMFMTQAGADEAEAIQKWGAKAYQIVTSKTDAELEEFMRITHPDSYFEGSGWHKN